ncbi:MAG: DUF1501 domain-containing protein [Gemmatales bacterium]|nr:DUF1501 domain-containing protein [Gemmatales bacterium]MDW8176596.1 DUF1501 domain-containing protein [Gemmatales bacterium]
MLNRREFLQTSLVGSSLVALQSFGPGFLARTALAAPTTDAPGAKDTILVVIQLTGGNDGLNTVVPFKDPLYAKYRPTLKLPENQLRKVNDELGLHPSMTGFAELLQDGALCIVQGVGYPNPSQSHFRSMDIWHAASTKENLTEGWLGKALHRLNNAPAFHVAMANEPNWLALQGGPFKVPALTSLDDLQFRLPAATGADQRAQRDIVEGAVKRPAENPLLHFVQQTALNTYENTRRLREIGRNYQPKVPYPQTGLGNRLRLVAQLIEANLGARIYYVSLDGFDTHAAQANAHANLLAELSNAVTAFFRDMAARGHRDRICIMTFSEFGRRAQENGSRGTDHGSAAPMFLVGGRVRAGVLGAHPSLEKLEFGNLKHHTDFRQVYAAVLEKWLGIPSVGILDGQFAPLDAFRS